MHEKSHHRPIKIKEAKYAHIPSICRSSHNYITGITTATHVFSTRLTDSSHQPYHLRTV